MATIMKVMQKISRFFGKHQLLKNSVIAGGLMGGGDIISQVVIEKTEKYNFVRTGRFVFLGSFVLGPLLYRWYGILEGIAFKSAAVTAVARMTVDQLTLAPSFLYVFFWLNGGLQGFTSSEIYKTIQRDYKDVLITNYQLWPAVQMINFSFVPLVHRVLFAQTFALFWNTYLAWKMNRASLAISEPI